MQGQQFSAILPNQQPSPVETLAQMQQQLYARKQQEAAMLKEQQERADMWLKEAYHQLDYKNFASGTVLDPIISTSLEEAKKAIAKKIMDNPSVSAASLLYDVATVAGDVTQYSTKAKNIKAQVEAMAKEYAKNPSVDVSLLTKAALTRAFMKYDPNTHTIATKDPYEIDDTQDYVTPNLGSAINSDEALYERINKAPYNPYKKEWTVDRGGVRRQVAYEGKYSPVFHDLTDEKGNVVDGQNTPATGLSVRSTPVKIGDKTFQGVSDEAYRYFTTDPVTNAILDRDAKAYVAQNPSLNIDDVKRVLLHGKLSNYTKGYINNTKNTVDDSQKQSQDFRMFLKTFAAANGKNPDEIQWNNIYQQIDDKLVPGTTTTINHLPGQDLMMGVVKNINVAPEGVTQDQVTIRKDLNGNLSLMVDGKLVTPITKIGMNLKANSGQKPRAAVIKDAQQTTPTTQQQTSGKTITKEVFRKMSIIDRQTFLSNGGKIQ